MVITHLEYRRENQQNPWEAIGETNPQNPWGAEPKRPSRARPALSPAKIFQNLYKKQLLYKIYTVCQLYISVRRMFPLWIGS